MTIEILEIEVPEPFEDAMYRRELLTYQQNVIDEHPRSAQAQIGPSEVGGCPTKVAWKLVHGGDSEREGGFAAHKGTLYHEWLDIHVFGRDGGPTKMPDGSQRWFSNLSLEPVVPWVNGGTLDLYDLLHQRVIDFKVPGDYTMTAVRNGKLGLSYYIQSMIYGLGLEQQGYPVTSTGLLYIPQCGDELHAVARGAVLKLWHFDRTVALKALGNANRIKAYADEVGIAVALETLPKRSDWCASCPAFLGNNDRRATCPGVVDRPVAKKKVSSNPFATS